MTGNEILILAGELYASRKTPSEALCRAIVGRSYYAAYHLTLALFAELGLPETNHYDTAQCLIHADEPNARNAGRFLKNLYEARRRADYDLDEVKAIQESRNREFVKDQIEMATDIKRLLGRCAVEPARSQVRAGIRNHIEQGKK